jgi:hypothetical protein
MPKTKENPMSHFKVLVIGDDIETQLEPFNENKETEAYQDTDFIYADEVKTARSFYERNPDLEPEIDRASDHAVLTGYKEGEDLRWNDDKTEATLWSTYNPDSKWDWWTIGGRYNTSMRIKPDANADDFTPSAVHWTEGHGNEADHHGASDHARKRAIDYPAMIAKQRADAEAAWDKLTASTMGIEPPASGWADIRERHTDIDDARREHNAHPWNTATRKAGFWDAYEDFHMAAADPRASYIADREASAVGGYYAVLHDGEWTARGDMGWFGMSSNETDRASWVSKVSELIDGLPDDTWLTTVDCHI